MMMTVLKSHFYSFLCVCFAALVVQEQKLHRGVGFREDFKVNTLKKYCT